MGKFARSYEMTKASWNILISDKKLLFIPLISGLLSLVVLALTVGSNTFLYGHDLDFFPYGLIVSFVYYLIIYSITIFFNVALTYLIINKIDNKNTSISLALKFALSHSKNIFLYALISSTVGIIIEAVNHLAAGKGVILGLLANIFAFVGSLTWSIATFLVIPILVIEGKSPIDALKESSAYLKKTWGEQIIGGFSIGAVIFVFAALPIILSLFIAITAINNISPDAGIFDVRWVQLFTGLILFLITVIIAGIVSTAMDSIFRVFVYKYAATGIVPSNINPELIKSAFVSKPKRKFWSL